jgi:hypothetical protein
MHEHLADPTARRHQLEEVLLHYLQTLDASLCPGGDGLTVEDILLTYPQASAVGQVPAPQELCREYPDLREDLDAFFARRSPLQPVPPH